MNEELKSRLIHYLDMLEDAGKKGAEFVSDQAPETVKQFVRWEILSNSIWTVACLAGIAAVTAIYFKVIWRYSANSLNVHEDGWFIRGIFGAFSIAGIVALSVCGMDHFIHAIKAYIAPNVFLIEKAAELLK